MTEKGRFVVIEGSDGSGKTKQVELLTVWLETNKIPFAVIDFPRYEQSFHGALVGRYLRGEFGSVQDVNPYLASLTYAGDRLEAKPKLQAWLLDGKLVVANRYIGSNLAHMSAKLPNGEREAFIDWLKQLEYSIHQIPKEDLTVFLYVPVDVAQKLIEQKGERNYIGGKKKDIHEADIDFMRRSEEQFLYLAEKEPHWVVVECVANGQILSPEEIHQKVIDILKSRGIV
ncbi:MAG: thymidylate kinase [bacterium]|nr:thymidylate kinase [bacterium]